MRITRMMAGLALLIGAVIYLTPAYATDITGAGATFPYPIYAKWAEVYKKNTGSGLNYQSIGSGGGIKQVKARMVDFGASDMPLTAEDLQNAGLVQFPAIIGGVVPIVNLDGIEPGQMKLTGEVLAAIYLGKITKWNAPEIVALNAGLKLPAADIAVVHRSDGSGSTFLLTDYLSKMSPDFKNTVGSHTAVKWPLGMGGKGNAGVAANVQRIKNTIGYVEYSYAKKNKMIYTQLKNSEGVFIDPDDENFKAAAASADWVKTPGMNIVLTNQPGKKSWPITGASFILMHKTQDDSAKAKEVLNFFDWAFKNGTSIATELDYVTLPDTVTKQIEDSWKVQIKDRSAKALW